MRIVDGKDGKKYQITENVLGETIGCQQLPDDKPKDTNTANTANPAAEIGILKFLVIGGLIFGIVTFISANLKYLIIVGAVALSCVLFHFLFRHKLSQVIRALVIIFAVFSSLAYSFFDKIFIVNDFEAKTGIINSEYFEAAKNTNGISSYRAASLLSNYVIRKSPIQEINSEELKQLINTSGIKILDNMVSPGDEVTIIGLTKNKKYFKIKTPDGKKGFINQSAILTGGK